MNKAAFAEHAIYLVKRRLYRLIRSLVTDNWYKYLLQVVKNLNDTRNAAIGNLKPNEINSPNDDVKIDNKIGFKKLPSVENLEENERNYLKIKDNLKPGDHVYLDFPSKPFDKSFDLQRGQLFIVKKVLAGQKPEIFYLIDLLKDPVPGTFYRQQLHKTKPPDSGDLFKVERVLQSKKLKGISYSLVKYLGYPNKFNEWIESKNLKVTK